MKVTDWHEVEVRIEIDGRHCGTPRPIRDITEEARRIINEIARHVDSDNKPRMSHIEHFKCSHCGYPWTEDEGNSNCCCDEEIAEHEARTAKPS